MYLPHYLVLAQRGQAQLATAFRAVSGAHPAEIDVHHTADLLAQRCDRQAEALTPFLDRYGSRGTEDADPDSAPTARLAGTRGPGLGLMRDLQDLYLMAAEADICWIVIDRAAQGARDAELLEVVRRGHGETGRQLGWLRTQLSQAAVQTLVVA